MEPGAPSTADVDEEARTNGGVTPTHGRTMKEQKAWFVQRAAAHRAAAATRTIAPSESETEKESRGTAAAAKSDGRDELAADVPGDAPPRPPAALAEQQASHAESDALSDGLSDALRELALAGGDLPALGALATGESRSELTTALKALGFKGLKTRQDLEQQLREWQEVQ